MSLIELQNFQVHTLKPFDIKVDSELVCLSGPSGSGKSLLLRAIADLIIHKGDAFLDGKKCSTINPVVWRKQVGYLAAESEWWQDQVGDHFTEKNEDLIRQLKLDKNCFEWEVSRCSTGEKQRLAILRLIANYPKVLLLDEPTASLDEKSVKAVEEVILWYSEKFSTPVIWVSHDEQQVKRISQRAYKIQDNEIIEVEV